VLNIDLKDNYLVLVREGNNHALMSSSIYQIPDLFSNNINKLRPLLHVLLFILLAIPFKYLHKTESHSRSTFLHGRVRATFASRAFNRSTSRLDSISSCRKFRIASAWPRLCFNILECASLQWPTAVSCNVSWKWRSDADFSR